VDGLIPIRRNRGGRGLSEWEVEVLRCPTSGGGEKTVRAVGLLGR
jgi:hypothetical protein